MYNVIVNPTANNKKAEKVIKKISKYLKSQAVEFLVYFSESSDDVTNITKKLSKDGERQFIIVGGDGTLNHFVNGLTDPSKTNFGIIPAGKHNHFARYLNLPKKPICAIKNILENPTIKVDYLKCNEYRALNLISCGTIEIAESKYLSQNKDSKLSRRKILNDTLKTFEGITLNIEADNLKQKNKQYTACAVCNGGFYGNNLYVSPLSNMHDGLANIVTIDYIDTMLVKKDYKITRSGKHIYKKPTSNSWSTQVKISAKEPFDTMIDGEIYQFDTLEINVIAKGLNIYTKPRF
ncbi:MAG: diacylglycerol/lipid kinase family protein [Clostridia bacterium]